MLSLFSVTKGCNVKGEGYFRDEKGVNRKKTEENHREENFLRCI